MNIARASGVFATSVHATSLYHLSSGHSQRGWSTTFQLIGELFPFSFHRVCVYGPNSSAATGFGMDDAKGWTGGPRQQASDRLAK